MVHPTPIWLKKFEWKKGQNPSPKTQFKPTAKWVDLPCKECGKLVHLTETKAQKYWGGRCSKKCVDDFKRTGNSVIKHCEYCQKEFRVIPCNKDISRFCSYACFGKARRKSWTNQDKHLRASWQYRKWRMGVLVKDKFLCQDCLKEGKTTKGFVAHHIEQWHKRLDLRFEVSNGVALCRKHHIERHKDDLFFCFI